MMSPIKEDTIISTEVKPCRRDSILAQKGICFWEALKIPGVLQYSLSYLCLKLSLYGMILWLPMYLQLSYNYSDYETSAVASMFDIGCVIGSFVLGSLTDLTYCRRLPVTVLGMLLGGLL